MKGSIRTIRFFTGRMDVGKNRGSTCTGTTFEKVRFRVDETPTFCEVHLPRLKPGVESATIQNHRACAQEIEANKVGVLLCKFEGGSFA